MGQRGKTPLTEAMFYVLMAFRRGELCGTEIAAAVERRTEGRVRLGPGTLYTILGRFLEEELIREVSVHGRQRNYRLTEEGHKAVVRRIFEAVGEVYQAELARLHRCVADAEKEERHDTSD